MIENVTVSLRRDLLIFFLSLLPNRVNPDPIVPAWFVKRQLLFSIVVSYYRIEEWALT